MATRLTLLDLAKRNGSDAVVGLIEEVQNAAPEVSVFDNRTISGTSYKTLIRTGLPSIAFRNANEGQDPATGTFAEKLVQAHILSGRIVCDKAVLAGAEDGPESVKADEASGVMEAALQHLGKQIYYGTVNDGKGFPGLQSLVDDSMVVDATGSTAATGSSVYAVKFGPRHIQLVWGKNTPFSLSPWRDETALDSNSKGFAAEVADLLAWSGLQCVNKYAVGRIKDCTADSGKGLTDALLAQLFAKFPVGTVPDAVFMSRRSRSQLQISRTVVLHGTGTSRPNQPGLAPLPTEYDGVPIIATDSIIDTETLT
jgi:L-amino acid N-acyltransferase YncA